MIIHICSSSHLGSEGQEFKVNLECIASLKQVRAIRDPVSKQTIHTHTDTHTQTHETENKRDESNHLSSHLRKLKKREQYKPKGG